MTEAPSHAHNVARQTFVEVGGVTQAAPAPRFSRSASGSPGSAPDVGEHTDNVLSELGFDLEQVAELRRVGAVQ
jgi:alpha-methylacyl-CoA racemase